MARLVAPKSFARQPLDVILTGTASVRVLRALLAHGGLLSVSRLAGDTLLTPNGTRDAMALLERAGVVESLGSGRTRLYRAIAAHPVVIALDALFAAERARFEAMLAGLTAACDVPAVSAAWLFGSVARGEDTRDSDLDLAVVVDAPEPNVDTIADAVRERAREHERRLGFTSSIVAVSVGGLRRLRAERARLWSELLHDARVLRGPSPAQIAERGAADLTADQEPHA